MDNREITNKKVWPSIKGHWDLKRSAYVPIETTTVELIEYALDILDKISTTTEGTPKMPFIEINQFADHAIAALKDAITKIKE